MNLKELAEELEADAEQCNSLMQTEDMSDRAFGAMEGREQAMKEVAGVLRAATTEQPLSRQWREEADGLALLWKRGGPSPLISKADGKRECAADLDNYHDEGRELLKASIFMLGFLDEKFILANKERNAWVEMQSGAVKELIDRIRNHLDRDNEN